MQKVKLITDSSCDLPKELLEKHNIDLLAVSIIFGEQEFKDYYELDQKSFLHKLKESQELPTTAQLYRTDIMNVYKKALDQNQSAIYVTLSSKASGTHNLAHIVKQELEEEYGHELDITIIDSLSFSLVTGRAVYEAALMAEQGRERDEIIQHIHYLLENTSVRFIVNDLTYLKNGGRIKAGEAIVAGVLGIVPILTVDSGLVVTIAKERGMKKALQKVVDDIKADIPSLKTDSFWFVHCDNMKNAMLLQEKLKENFTIDECHIYETYATISTHAGPGVCAVFYVKEQ